MLIKRLRVVAIILPLLSAAVSPVVALSRQTSSRPRTATGTLQTRTQGASGGRVVVANEMPGANLSAKIKNADASLGPARGEIQVRGGGTLNESVTIGEGHTLKLLAGTYQIVFNITDTGAFLLKDGASIAGEGRSTVIVEPRKTVGASPVRVIQAYSDIVSHDAASRDLNVRDLQIKGADDMLGDGIRQTVTLGNCSRCTVENVFLNGTHGIGIQAGGTPDAGNFSSDVRIKNNYLLNVPSQNIAVVNGERVYVEGNTIKDPTAKATTALAAIDVEVNTGRDKANDIFITDNTLDLRGAAQSVFAIQYQSAGVANGGKSSVIRGNKILGHPYYTAAGIVIADPYTADMLIEDNFIENVGVTGISLNGRRLTVRRNLMKDGGTDGCIVLGTLSDSKITNNKCETREGASGIIKETISVKNNYIAFNTAHYLIRTEAAAVSNNTYEGNDLSRQVPGHANGFVNHSVNISGNKYIDNVTASLDDPTYHSGFPPLAAGEKSATVQSHRTVSGGLKVYPGNRRP
ncbi:MAG TPA: right-handed parallel beta-helix repeat-containing protein [Pyrinomonadaceae bacterium]|jgi:hypothetical protein|nr:right-handed parallel beta-helix repeat-containing protein [Pyrinomonadaceae bacterium]